MATFLITLREGIEIALILAIIFGYLAQTGRRHHVAAVWRGVVAAAAICVASGASVFLLFDGLEGRSEELSEAIIMFATTAVLTWMIFWMRSHARAVKGELTSALASATTALSVSLFAAAAVAREGFETVMFLLGAGVQSGNAASVMGSALGGFAASAVLGWAIYNRGVRLNLNRFFTVTGVALILFAASSLAYGAHELREYLGVEGVLSMTLWSVDAPMLASDSLLGGVLGMFGWMPHPELLRVAVFAVYVVPMLVWFMRPSTSGSSASGQQRAQRTAAVRRPRMSVTADRSHSRARAVTSE